ncbi:MAG TPA: O-antigen ligase family protein, partial [Elusimicrobiota bacterium]|nr:O-antigen ligase family protein [Elusimicrobiota bacterium]
MTAAARPAWTLRLLAAALLLGGLRDQRLFAAGGAAVWALVWLERPPLGLAAAWLPWLGWALVSACASASPLSALPVLARWAAALGFASLAAAWTAREREDWVKTLLAAGAVLAGAALWTGGRTGQFRNAMTGLIPPYYNYTAFALAAAAAAGAAWALHPKGPRGARRAAALAFAAGALGCLVLARSRGALLGMGAASLVWSARRWGPKAAGAWLFAAGAAGAFALSSPAARGAIFKTYRPRGEARPLIWRAAEEVASDSPWLGEGPGNFGAGFLRHQVPATGSPAREGLTTRYAHSEVLQAAGETGWAGLVLWLAALGTALSALWGRAGPEPAREAAAAAAAAMAAQLLVDDMLQIPGLALLFFSALAAAGARPRGGPRWPRAAAAAGAALALAAWIPRALADGSPARAALLFPTDPGPVEDLAYRAEAQGRPAQADAEWAKAAALAPYDAVYPWRRAQLAAARGDWAGAESLSARAVGLEPDFPRARLLRAAALVRLGRRADARGQLAELRARL